VPTIDHNRYYIDAAEEYQFRPGSKEGLSAYIHRNYETAQRANKAGVKFAMGSDAVYSMFGQNTRELTWFVKLGMTPEAALKTATVDAADLLGDSRDIGWATPGHFADLIAVEGDPLQNVNDTIDKIQAVMKGGKIVIHKQ
jgi:imidazolonepropionase-like amidohydrolase